MTDDIVYSAHSVFRVRDRDPDGSWDAAEWEVLFKELGDRVEVRGAYTCEGLRPDADLMLWLVARRFDDIQDLVRRLRRTAIGRRLEPTHAFTGVVRPPEFNPQHLPAFLRGEKPRTYLCVYPFVRTPEWYLLPAEERAALLREHGEMGREFPDVLPNTTSAFGLGDWEWILAFEADELHRIVDCVRRLRDSASRRYVKEEVPFVVGIRKPVAEALADLA
jgi:peroxiredoxin